MAETLLEENILEPNSDNFVGLKSLDGSLHISLIEKYYQKLIDGIGDFSLDNNDWCMLLDSKQINLNKKREILEHLTIQELSDTNVAKKVVKFHPDKKIHTYGFDEIKALLSHLISLKKRISVLLKYLDGLSNDQLKAIVSPFGEDYADLFGLHKMPSFPNHEPNYLLLKELERRDIISSVAKEGEKIRARCRRKK